MRKVSKLFKHTKLILWTLCDLFLFLSGPVCGPDTVRSTKSALSLSLILQQTEKSPSRTPCLALSPRSSEWRPKIYLQKKKFMYEREKRWKYWNKKGGGRGSWGRSLYIKVLRAVEVAYCTLWLTVSKLLAESSHKMCKCSKAHFFYTFFRMFEGEDLG